MKIYIKPISWVLIIILQISICFTSFAEESKGLELTAQGALLMEASTGKILYEKNSHEKLLPASVTKVMSLLLIMEALDSGKIKLNDAVTVSENAASMGGSQVFLEAGEQMSVHDMLKAITVSSGNDATVAMAEYIAGSEQGFIEMMNKRAKELGMNDSLFYNTTGLDDVEPCNVTSANDIALMSKELIKHPKIFEYTTIWIDSLRNGQFGLANTNKLIRFYPGANGLKTGSTSKAKYNLSGSAIRDNLQLIATVMCAPSSKDRFSDAKKMLDYGFANYRAIKIAKKGDTIREVEVDKGLYQKINAIVDQDINIIVKKGEESSLTPQLIIPAKFAAPLKKGQKLGEIIYKVKDVEVGRYNLVCEKDVAKINVLNAFSRVLKAWVEI